MITIHILAIISRSKKNQVIKFGQLIREIFLFKNHEAGRLAPDLYLFFKKALYEVKASDLQIII